MAQQLGGVDLNNPGSVGLEMPNVAAALADVANGLDDQAAVPNSRSQSQRLSLDSRASRRRSSSRVVAVPHSVQDEEPPQSRFHDPAVQQAYAGVKNIMERLTVVLASSSLHSEPDSAMRRLHQQSEKLGRFQCASTRTVGFVGDSGVGECT